MKFDDIDQTTLDQLSETAAETAAKTFPFLKLLMPREGGAPDWKVSDTIVTDMEAIVRTDEAAMSYARFSTGSKTPVEETPWLLALFNKKPPRPNSFTDKSKWDVWDGGRPKDPWVFRTRVPLQIKTGPLEDRIVTYNGENAASRYTISDLQALFAQKRRRPLVLLTYERNGNEYTPAFKVIRLTEDDTATPGLNHLKSSPVVDERPDEKPADPQPPAQVNGGGGLNDEIPFAAEFR